MMGSSARNSPETIRSALADAEEVPRPVVRIDCLACQSAGAAEGAVGSMEAIMQNVPWNKGRLTGQKRPLKPKDVWAIRVRLQLQRRARDCWFRANSATD